ncbi:MAG TPA: DinB family protein [Aggregatilineales bacterium]|nr:DinB family protein [Aggregatilineales bacterium]
MSDRKTEVLDTIEAGRQKLNAVLGQLQADDWEKPIQDADQQWTVRQIVAHLVDAQKGMAGQITKINAGTEAIPPDFDLNRWNKRTVEKSADKTRQELLAALSEGHSAVKQVIESLSENDFQKQGRHSSLRIMTLEEFGKEIGKHEMEHAQIIADKLGLK